MSHSRRQSRRHERLRIVTELSPILRYPDASQRKEKKPAKRRGAPRSRYSRAPSRPIRPRRTRRQMRPSGMIEMRQRNMRTVRRIVLRKGICPRQEHSGADRNRCDRSVNWQSRERPDYGAQFRIEHFSTLFLFAVAPSRYLLPGVAINFGCASSVPHTRLGYCRPCIRYPLLRS
jgi:hypothetical protein